MKRKIKREKLRMLVQEALAAEATKLGISWPHGDFNELAREIYRVKGLSFRGDVNRTTVAGALRPEITDIVMRPSRLRQEQRKNRPKAIYDTRPWSEIGRRAPGQKEIDDFYESWEWKRLRYDFIKLRQQRCGSCGATPTDGIRIVVDHIKPIRHFWNLRLDISNLQILCDDCNKGKGSRDTTDWSNVVKFPS